MGVFNVKGFFIITVAIIAITHEPSWLDSERVLNDCSAVFTQ